jgi:hypothetical protein
MRGAIFPIPIHLHDDYVQGCPLISYVDITLKSLIVIVLLLT